MPRRLLLAVDEARALLPKKEDNDLGWFRILRRVLARTNQLIEVKSGSSSGVFGIVVDTNSKIADFAPSAAQDPSHRPDHETSLFPPFVLTETVDVFHRIAHDTPKADQYKQDVLQAIQRDARRDGKGWEPLCDLGRPLWKSMCIPPKGKSALKETQCIGRPQASEATTFLRPDRNEMTKFAARKLLMGGVADSIASLNDTTMNGVGSMLCRVGLRPFASSPLASRTVADFMAVLSSVGFEHEHYIVSYSSDPILTLGAARIWHAIDDQQPLATKILPELRKMMHQELVDTGNAGEMVAKIMLVLAMDACGVMETGHENSRWNRVGEFSSVWTFMSALHGETPKMKRLVRTLRLPKRGRRASSRAKRRFTCVDTLEPAATIALNGIKTDWMNWFVSFTHFVQLDEHPSEDCLWAMLARRVAGAFPRGQKGVDLVIPICTSFDEDGNPETPRVSMILIQVKNCRSGDKAFPKSATEGMLPSAIFKKGGKVPANATAFQALRPESVIRVYMSLRGHTNEQRFYLADNRPCRRSTYVLCLQGLSAWRSKPDPDTTHGDTTAAAANQSSDSHDGTVTLDSEVMSCDEEETRGKNEEKKLWTGPSGVHDRQPVEVLSKEIADQLKPMLRPWWKVKELVDEDLKARDKKKVFGESRKSLRKLAALPLAETLLLNINKVTRSTKSRLGRTDKPKPFLQNRLSGTRRPRAQDGYGIRVVKKPKRSVS